MPEKRVKYGARCEGAKARSRGCLCFTVFAAFYVDACSENRVKYGTRGAVTVPGLVFLTRFFKALEEVRQECVC